MDKTLYENSVLIPLLASVKVLVPGTQMPMLGQAKLMAAELW